MQWTIAKRKERKSICEIQQFAKESYDHWQNQFIMNSRNGQKE